MSATPDPSRGPDAVAAARRRARKTALVVAVIAVAVYVLFMLQGAWHGH